MLASIRITFSVKIVTVPNVLGTTLDDVSLMEYIHQIMLQYGKRQHSAVVRTPIPDSYLNLLKSKVTAASLLINLVLKSVSFQSRSYTLIFSKQACRSAIMFGDELTKAECEDLLQRLSKCHLPFECAHGRPSIVPLFQLHR